MTGTSLVPRPQEMEELAALGKNLFDSGCFPDVKGGAQAVVKILAGREYGVPPIEAMRSFHIMHDGKIEPAADLLARAVKGHPIYDYRVLVHTDEECSIRFTERDEILGTSTFTLADAKQAGLLERSPSGKPGAWEKYPPNMLFNRAMTNGVAWLCPDVLSPPRLAEVPPMPFVVADVVVPSVAGEIADGELSEDVEGAGDTTASTPSADPAGSEPSDAPVDDVVAEAEQPGAGGRATDDGDTPAAAPVDDPASGTAVRKQNMATKGQLAKLAVLANALGMDDTARHEAAGVDTFKALTRDEAHELIEDWQRRAAKTSEPEDALPSAELANRALRHFVTRPKLLASVRAAYPEAAAAGALKDYSNITHAQMVTALEAGLKGK